MPNLEEIQKEIQALPEEAQLLLLDFIEVLKKHYVEVSAPSEQSPYQKFRERGFIGCVSIEENLSTTYKQVLSEKLGTKYDHR